MEILVHVKAHEMRSEPVGVATRLAKAVGARLTGLHTSRDMAALRNMFGDGAQSARSAKLSGTPRQRLAP